MKKIKIIFDVDGVLLNFMQTISNYIESNYQLKSSIVYAPTQYSLFERFEEAVIEKLDFDKIKSAFESEGYWKSLEPMPDIELMKEVIHNPLFDIHFVTSIPVHLHGHRKQNLNTLLKTKIADERLICVPLGESKKPYIKSLQPDIFIEDNFKNLVDCHGEHQSFWIDLNENYYDLSQAHKYDFKKVQNLNEALKTIRAQTYKMFNHEELIKQIQDSLSDDLLSPMYAKLTRSSPTEGHCYASAEALYHMLGGTHAGLTAYVASFMENGQKMTHWWLRNSQGDILDPTAEQFYAVGQKPPYEAGHAAGFLTKAPSKRAQEIIKRVVGDSVVPVNSTGKKKKHI